MPMKPEVDEEQSDFMGRCVPEMMDSNPDWENDRAVAACMTMWRDAKGESKAMLAAIKKKRDGQPVSETAFMNDCMSELQGEGFSKDEAREECEILWGELGGFTGRSGVRHKTHVSPLDGDGLEFVLSDATPDRLGDIIDAKGWDLRNFLRNPIALFNHSKDFPIGRWENLRVEKGSLKGKLRLAPEGTSARIDEVRKLIQAGILRAVSVGFKPIEFKPRTDVKRGDYYAKSELVETSVVAIPANPNALAVAKALGVSDETRRMVFAKHGSADLKSRDIGSNGKHARTTRAGVTHMTSSLSQRVEDAQNNVVALKDALTEHLRTYSDETADDTALAVTEEYNRKIEIAERNLGSLRQAESRLMNVTKAAVVNGNGNGAADDERDYRGGVAVRNDRPFAAPTRKVKPVDYMWRALTIQLCHHFEKAQRPLLDVLKAHYGEDDITRRIMANFITRAAAAPADTTTTGWAAELVQTAVAEFFGLLQAVAIYPQLAAKGARYTFGRNGIISIPTRASTPTIAGSFVLQGAAIPVRQAAFAAVTLTPKKMAVISTFTREIAEHSTPDIEQLIRSIILEDTATSIDSVLLDATAASAARPAGLRFGVSSLTPTAAGTGLEKLVADIRGLITALTTATKGNFRAPVFLMSPGDALTVASMQTTTGDMPFRQEIAGNTLFGVPVIQSTSVTADTVYLIDAADFVTATEDTPRFDVSDQAVLHMEDTSPTALAAVGTPNTVSAPARSLWQTDTLGVRMILPMNWAMRRTGMVQYVTGVTWNI